MTIPKEIILHDGYLRVSFGNQGQVDARLLNGLYGLKQMNLNWFEILDDFLPAIGLQKVWSELWMYVMCRTDTQAKKAVLAWANNMILFGDNNDDDDGDIERFLKQRF